MGLENAKRILVVATWGLPSPWRKVNYLLEVKPPSIEEWGKYSEWQPYDGKPIPSYSTTVALIKALEESGWSTKALIFGLETLTSSSAGGDNEKKDVNQKHSEIVGRLCGNIPSCLRDAAREILNLWVKKYFEDMMDKVAGIHILPGAGVYNITCNSGKRVFKYNNSPLLFSFLFEYIVFKSLLELKPDAVILDITHGVNYMPSLAIRSIERPVKVYSALSSGEVGLAVTNSDPVQQNTQESTIHFVMVKRISEEPLPLLREISDIVIENAKGKLYYMRRPEKPQSIGLKSLDELKQKVKTLKEDLKVISKAYDYGLALYLIEKLTQEYDVKIPDFEEIVWNECNIESKDSEVTISREYILDQDLIMSIIYAKDLLSKVRQSIGKEINYTVINNEYNLYSIECLKKICIKYIGKLLLEYELDSIRENIKELLTGDQIYPPASDGYAVIKAGLPHML
ncbi:CRISPR-associated DxTHG motif protein [Stygiolobus azoricus]|uniref:CRISPR-associated DxTHG motif protein n=1 Tax=Stygiolobus azoricus TaxID=41675 RepID=A0A650CPI5_9CREN|nr:TM1812 family CRISPR-associated protein [Stygiolobus azoricus]QGR19698.1 CRISPR-associated DxTHG motif protein [Stygiolobus azoricus]